MGTLRSVNPNVHLLFQGFLEVELIEPEPDSC